MAAEVAAFVLDLQRETSAGNDPSINVFPCGTVRCHSLPKNKAAATFDLLFKIPGNATLTTGLKVEVLLTDDGSRASDLGKVVRLGAAAKKIVGGTDNLDLSTGAGTEATADVTLNSTSGVAVIGTISITNANLDSAAAGDWIGIRFRRIADHANDTATGRVVCSGPAVYAY